MATVYHVTTEDRLPSIAERGLLTREQLEAIDKNLVSWPSWSKPGVVYVTHRCGIGGGGARHWKAFHPRYSLTFVTLRFKARIARKDANVPAHWPCHEIDGPIPADVIEVKTPSGRYMPLREFVAAVPA